jgi:hypothetical protein
LNTTTEHTYQYNQTMPNNTQDSALMICYRECLSNLEKLSDGEEQKVLQFINSIERIGNMIEANDNILHCMCTAKLDGEAKRWYEDNMTLTQWENLKPALLERFTTSDSSSRIFEQLKDRKQKSDETITSYYDAIIKLCHEYDSSMSQKMMISWLENGIKDSLKIQIKRQMKLLSESARTTRAFLKIAKDEQELQEEISPAPTPSYVPYFGNTVSTTLRRTEIMRPNESSRSYPSQTTTSHQSKSSYQQRKNLNESQRPPPPTRYSTSQQHSSAFQPRSYTAHHDTRPLISNNDTSFNSLNTNSSQFNPCFICQQNNHRTIDCYQKKPHGCYKCGQSDHRVRDCPQVFY